MSAHLDLNGAARALLRMLHRGEVRDIRMLSEHEAGRPQWAAANLNVLRQYLVDTRNGRRALRPVSLFWHSPLAWTLGISLLAAGLAGCTHMPLAQPRLLLMGAPVLTGLAQVLDPQTGTNYFVPCNPCAAPTAKTPVQLSGADTTDAADPDLTSQPVALPVLAKLDAHTVATLAVPADSPTIPAVSSQVAGEVRPVSVVATRGALHAATPLAAQAAHTLRSLPFPSAVALMNADAKDSLSSLLPLAVAAERIYIGGRADSMGTAQRNRILAAARAATVRAAFVAGGVDPRKLKVSSCITCFIAPNDTDAGRSANRRVEIELVMPAIANSPTSKS